MLKSLKGNIYFVLTLRLLIIYFLYSFCRIIFYLNNLSFFSGIDFGSFLYILYGGLKFDTTAIFYINLIFILSQVIPFKFRFNPGYQKVFLIVFYVTNAIGLLANFVDIIYYPFTLKRTTATVFSQFANENNMASLLFRFVVINYWYFTLLLISSIIFMILANKKISSVKLLIKNNLVFYIVSIALFLLTIGFVIAGLRGGFRHSTRPIAISNAGEFTQQPSEINLVINTPFSIIKTLGTEPLKIVDYFKDSIALNKIYNPIHNPDSNKQSFRKKNIVFIILESFNKDGGKYKGYTPFLDSLKSVSLSFNNAYANGRKSIEALPSILASIPGIKEPFILSYYSTNKIHGLGELLAKKGYQTSFFHGAPNGSMGFTSFTKMAGVAHYYGMTEYNNDADFDGMWGIWDEPFLQYWAKEMNTFKQPFFSTVFTVSSHHPFELPDKYKGKFPKGTLPVHQNIGYTDLSLKEFFATAKKSEWYQNTIFVITADHSSVSTHPEYKTSLGAFAIPIIIFDPSGELKGTYDEPVQQIDIMPTILNYLHYDKSYFAFGNDMLHRNSSAFVAQYIDERYQIIIGDEVLKFDEHQAPELYNYRDDVLLKHDISKRKRADKERLETNLKAFIQQYNQHMIDNSLGVK